MSAAKLFLFLARRASVWNPADKSASIALSNANRKATRNSDPAAYAAVRGVRGRAAGKYYFEITINQGKVSPAESTPGIAEATASLSNFIGGDIHGWGVVEGGTVFNNGGSTATAIDAFGTGDTVQIAVDFGNLKLWFAKVGGASGWNGLGVGGNPATNTGGITIAASTWLPAYAAFDNTQAATLNTGQVAFLGTVPSGFLPWG